MTFQELGLIKPILHALQQEGYDSPTPIQAAAIPILLQGKDLLACAQTGTGKTAAFAIPIIQQLHQAATERTGPVKIKALIVTPTRELAIQIGESFAAYGAQTGLKQTVIFGGVGQQAQVDSLRRGTDILVATPGRLLDLQGQGLVKLDNLSHFVLDEADRMLDMGFVHDVKRIIKLLPAKRQSLFFSATMPESIMALAHSILNNPERVEVTPVSSTAETIQQQVYLVDKDEKNALLLHLLEDKGIQSALIFTRTKYGADKVARFLAKQGIAAEAIHGNKSQNARQSALAKMKQGKIRALVATDIAARGIDIDELAFVINYEIPNIPETYVHRIGRTGRAGASGRAVSFCDETEHTFLADIQKLIKMKLPLKEFSVAAGEKIVEQLPVPQTHKQGKHDIIAKPQPRQHVRNHSQDGRPSNGTAPKKSNSWFKYKKQQPPGASYPKSSN